MPRPSERTRSKKRINKPLPGGNKGTGYRSKITGSSRCSACGQPLAGGSSLSPIKGRKLNRGKRRIWRPHGGQLCHNCLRNALKQGARTL